jgi:hypothetical protein
VRFGDPATARLQDRMNWLNRLVVCCYCHHPTLGSLGSAGFTVTEVEHTVLPKTSSFVRLGVVGRAKVVDPGLRADRAYGRMRVTAAARSAWRA